ncbi:M56 family metallopeptidase [Spirosoma utsteinense]|uniref:Beta-lactamase regulating signal transducer with metallopeptidase domain n=1 Tax=Spirosoma utsteinense TaxID=2585773 RepID=A0ABR6W2F4_9BACT|nr:M56 family metallopeptidase [Spirosoma utsteinense]MBC3784414.1 beta-lactamase regulating signal transducer with metallopeptidase domain [Spirosoma utsteinense]MBC3790786.1 beta-lactamase regulating signal transducer with metallopeptidase domain [Spirosoma utsteinense]
METLRYVVLANGLLAVVSIAYHVLLRRETFFVANRLALWVGLLASFILPLLELPDWRPQPVRAVMQRTAQVIVPKVLPVPSSPNSDVTITFPNGHTFRAFPNTTVEYGWSWQSGALAVYLIVLAALLCRFVIRLVSLRQLICQSTRELYDDFTLVKNDKLTSPFSFFKWVVLNPASHEPSELEQIMRHERVHVRAWHSLDMVAAELVSIIFWFNPAVHLFRQQVHQILEFSADQTVLAEGIDAKSYQYNLVKVSLSVRPSVISNQFSQPCLQERVSMMNRQRSRSSAWGRYLFALMSVANVAFACQLVSSKPSYRYIEQPGSDFYGLITSHTSQQDLDTLRRELSQLKVGLDVNDLKRLPNGQIHQVTVKLNVPKPGHMIDVSVGSSLKRAPIPALGLHCDVYGCQLGFVDEQFPKRLREIASRESRKFPGESETLPLITDANSVFGLFRVYFRNDFLESNYFGLRSTGLRMTPDFHLDVYPEYKHAVIFLDGREITRDELTPLRAIDLKKVVIFDGQAAVVRLGDKRAKNGLILVSRLTNITRRDKYASTPLLAQVYPQLFNIPR